MEQGRKEEWSQKEQGLERSWEAGEDEEPQETWVGRKREGEGEGEREPLYGVRRNDSASIPDGWSLARSSLWSQVSRANLLMLSRADSRSQRAARPSSARLSQSSS